MIPLFHLAVWRPETHDNRRHREALQEQREQHDSERHADGHRAVRRCSEGQRQHRGWYAPRWSSGAPARTTGSRPSRRNRHLRRSIAHATTGVARVPGRCRAIQVACVVQASGPFALITSPYSKRKQAVATSRIRRLSALHRGTYVLTNHDQRKSDGIEPRSLKDPSSSAARAATVRPSYKLPQTP